mmetsp:Transcript_16991/g.16670  ORF Transcript_16991/g.16670 Transcript_16991/m.16670 type:complete len:172 (-) Transcript_16991:288-803(-)
MNIQTKRFYCHNCRGEFRTQASEEIKCTHCLSFFCEEVDTDFPEESEYKDQDEPQEEIRDMYGQRDAYTVEAIDHPRLGAEGLRNRQDEGTLDSAAFDLMFSNLAGMLSGVIGDQLADQVAQQSMDNVIDQIMRNDPNNYGAPPASKEAIQDLQRGSYESLSKNIDSQDFK